MLKCFSLAVFFWWVVILFFVGLLCVLSNFCFLVILGVLSSYSLGFMMVYLLKIQNKELFFLFLDDFLKNSFSTFYLSICMCCWLIDDFFVGNILDFECFLKTLASFEELFFSYKVLMNIDFVFCVGLCFNIRMWFFFLIL